MLTDTAIRSAKGKEKAYRLFDDRGLYLEVMPNGSRYWRMKYRYLNKEKRLALGVYPEVSLAEAREKRDQSRKQLAGGVDPSFVKQEQKRLVGLNAGNTLEAVAREWHGHNLEKWGPNHAETILRRLERDLFPGLGHIPIKDISAPRLLKAIQDIEKRGAHEVARRAWQVSGQVFRYAVVTGRAEFDPSSALKGALKPFKRGHYAAFEAKELPEFLSKLYMNEARLFVQTRLAIELMMLTFVRTSELIMAKWSELELEEKRWVIPAERMKMRKPHIVPLSEQSLVILAELKKMNGHREWIFPAQTDPRKHMSNNTILMALGRMGYRGKMTGHGFRALAMSTIKEKLGYRHEVVDRQLAHAHRNTVDAAYDRAKFLEERAEMMQKWANYLQALATNGKVAVGVFGKAA